MTHLKYLNALAGSGKTYGAINKTENLLTNGEAVIIAVPSIKLQNQIASDAAHLNPRVINTNTIKDDEIGVLSEVAILDPKDNPLTIITHAALMQTPYVQRKRDYHLIIDEVINPLQFLTINWSEHRDLLVENTEHRACGNNLYVLHLEFNANTKAILRNKKKDQLWYHIKEFYNLFADHDVYVSKSQYDGFLKGDNKQLSFVALQTFKQLHGWKSVTWLGAMFNESLVAELLKKKFNFKLSPVRDIPTRYTKHDGKNVEFNYFYDCKFSKSIRDRDLNTIPNLIKQTETALNGEDYLVVANNDVESLSGNGIRIPVDPKGLNEYQQVHNILFLAALNLPPIAYTILEELGLSPETVDRAISRQTAYQAILRTSLRNPDSTDKVRVFVADKPTAEWLAGWFEGSTLKKHGSQQVRLSRGNQKRQKELTNRVVKLIQDGGVLNTLYKVAAPPPLNISFTPAIKQAYVIYNEPMAAEDLMCLLKESHAKHFKADNNFMICQSEITNSHRKNDNVVAMNFMVLDVDFPEVLPVEEMQKALSGIRCLITNTKSSTKETPKYRVYMPFRSPCNVDDYRALEGIIKTRIKLHCQENGITRPKNSPAHNAKSFYGIDKASFVLSQAFWLPSRADFSFICELEGDFIDVIEWLYEKRKVSEPRYDPEFVYSMPKNLPTPANDIEDKVEAIKSHYLCLTDNHNNEFYKATLKLCRLGLSEGEILNVLYELGRSHKPSKYAQSGHINAAIKNARRYLQVA